MGMNRKSSPQQGPLSIGRTIWKGKLVIAIGWPLLTAIAFAVVYRIPPIYSADAVILVDSQKIPEKFVSSTVSTELQDRLATISQQILSTTRLKKVIDDFGLYQKERKSLVQEEIIELMRNDIKVTVEKGWTKNRPGAFRIAYKGTQPTLVAQVANRLANLFIEENLKTREIQAEGTAEFMEVQLQESKKQLDSLEKAVSEYKVKFNGELPQQETALLSTVGRLQQGLQANRESITRAEESKMMLEASVGIVESTLAAVTHTPETIPAQSADAASSAPEPARRQTRSEMLDVQLAALRLKYGENHPDVRRMVRELAQARALERSEQEANPAAPSVQTASVAPSPTRTTDRQFNQAKERIAEIQGRERIATLKSQILAAGRELEARKVEQKQIQEAIAAYQRRIEHLPVREQEIAIITRDYEISKANYHSLLSKRISADMATDMERRQKSERFAILDPARIPEKPATPNRPLLISLGSGLGLLFSMGFVFLREMKQNVLLGEWELPPGTPVLGRLPNVEPESEVGTTPGMGRELSRRLQRLSPSRPLLRFDGSHSIASEQYRVVRTRIIQHHRHPKIIVISSPSPGDGKSVTATNLATALALKPQTKVLLADADFRRPSIHSLLGLPEGPGLANVLAGTHSLAETIVESKDFPNLSLLVAGPPQSNPAELLDSPAWSAVGEQLRSSFDYVIFDSPPIVAGVSDYDLIQVACDGIIIVIQPDKTGRAECLEALGAAPSGKFLGVLLNRVPEWFLAKHYSYQYLNYITKRAEDSGLNLSQADLVGRRQ
jgi:succinoglycan biosynthesis transport protein ExoP